MLHDYFASQTRYDVVALTRKFDDVLDRAVPNTNAVPADLHTAMRHSVLNGGKRIRPRLVLATAAACHGGALDEDSAELVVRAAVAVELIHSASLVHDDLPCFDDADLRRGKPSVHRAFGVPMAVLVGDALITLAFEILSTYEGSCSHRALALVRMLAMSTGSAQGIIGGQSLELSGHWAGDAVSMEEVEDYHRKKTAALFDYSMRAAAIAIGCSSEEQGRWAEAGAKLGLAFQLIDDLIDIHMDEQTTGKTSGRDRALERPNGALVEGSTETIERLSKLIDGTCVLIYELAKNPEPVLRLMESFDTMLVKLEIHIGDHLDGAQSGLFAHGVLGAEAMEGAAGA